MARDETPPFARGETFSNSQLASDIDTTNLGGVNLEGKEYVFEVNTPDTPANLQSDSSGRGVRVRVVRNLSTVNLKPGRIAHYKLDDPYECHVDGYTFATADRPAGIVDEYLPTVGVQPNDLFYIVVDGPTTFTQLSASASTFAIGDRAVPGVGTSATNDDAGRVLVQSQAGATTVLGNMLQNVVGYAGAAQAGTSNAQFKGVVHRAFK